MADIKKILQLLPTQSGVYIMKNTKGKILYIGKAKNLKKRVKAYFNNQDKRPSVQIFSPQVANIEWMLTENEKEALLLENSLIKTHKPKYNILLKDDKSEYCLRVNKSHEFPRIEIIRLKNRSKQPHTIYFGPYSSALALKKTLSFIQKNFSLRSCSDHVFKSAKKPCLEYHIKRCPGPCSGLISQEDYKTILTDAIEFLKGKNKHLLRVLQNRRKEFAENLEFEKAAKVHDQINALEQFFQNQTIVAGKFINIDVVACAGRAFGVAVECLKIRDGKIKEFKNAVFENTYAYESQDEILSSWLLQSYGAERAFVPEKIVLCQKLTGITNVKKALNTLSKRTVNIGLPSAGTETKMADMALMNANNLIDKNAPQSVEEELQKTLRLKNIPTKIVCFDISHQGGTSGFGSMVAFENLQPDKASYRVFSIEGKSFDDYKNMYDTVRRWLSKTTPQTRPDMVLIDGGYNQLKVALRVFEEQGVDDTDVVSMVKSEKGRDGIMLPDGTRICRQLSDKAYFALVRIRDEAHRFGITHSRKKHLKSTFVSELDNIPGLGPKRKKMLLDFFGNVGNIKNSTLVQIKKARIVPENIAENIYDYFHA